MEVQVLKYMPSWYAVPIQEQDRRKSAKAGKQPCTNITRNGDERTLRFVFRSHTERVGGVKEGGGGPGRQGAATEPRRRLGAEPNWPCLCCLQISNPGLIVYTP
jgi:hypothetical protein